MLGGLLAAFALIAAEGLSPFAPGEVKLGGEIGSRIDLAVEKILRHTEIDRDFLHPFRNRLTSDGDMKAHNARRGANGGFVGYGMLLDAAVKACARGIGGPELRAFKERRIAELIATQGEDGSISIFTDVPKGKIGWPQAAVWDNHEGFYIIQALVGDWRAFGNRAALDAARRLGDHFVERDGCVNVGGEAAFIMLWRATGDERYRKWLDDKADMRVHLERGYGKLLAANSVYHVYTGLARACAQLDFTAATGVEDPAVLATAWTVASWLFGGHLSVSGTCSGGEPNVEGEFWRKSQRGTGRWGETCATAYMMRFAAKMMAVDPDPKYGDLLERALYNAFFAAQSPDGVRYRYFTPFDEPGEWWPRDTYCCPNNFRREIFELPDAAILKTPRGVAINLYSAAKLKTKGLSLDVQTRYPLDGTVSIAADAAATTELLLRIPAWCRNAEVTADGHKTSAACGTWHAVALKKGRSDVRLVLPLADRYVAGREEQKGKVALLKGPLVYGVDKTGRRVRFSDPSRDHVYVAPPDGIVPAPDELLRSTP